LDDDGIAESNEKTVVVTFNEAGTYDGALTVTDSKGQTASDTVEITVEEGEEVASTEEESLTEETTQEETSCDSLYPITCMPSYPELNLSCNDISTRNSEALPQDPLRFNGNDDSSGDTGCETEDNQDGLGEPDDNNFGSDNLLGFYGSRPTGIRT
jgi:hypothetical protein